MDTQKGEKKRVLIVYAHPEETSFNASMLEAARTTLREQGCEVVVSDLHAMNFNPVAGRGDITGAPQDPKNYNRLKEVAIAAANGTLSPDIKAEQEKVKNADLVIFQFPMQWFSFPAILKGWVDRVLCVGFAYQSGKIYDMANMKGKKGMLSFSTGAPECFYTNKGPNGDISIPLWCMQSGLLGFCGFDILPPQISHGPNSENAPTYIATWETRLKTIFDEKPIQLLSMTSYDMAAGFQLKESVLKKYESKPHGPTTGQHLGKPIPPDFMKKA